MENQIRTVRLPNRIVTPHQSLRQKFLCYVGPVCSMKSDTLIREVDLALISGQEVVVFKPDRDTRDSRDCLESRSGRRIDVRPVHLQSSAEILDRVRPGQFIGIDEGHFFEPELAEVLRRLHFRGHKIVYIGLDVTWKGTPFPTTAAVMCTPEAKVVRLYGVCTRCGSDEASCSQYVDADRQPMPITLEAESIHVGFDFEPTCSRCWAETTPGAPR